ncbi:hypothetical protein AGR6A_Lc170069 [Agrobacterium sp. NCPPB 925]|nr:hypothetical protein AGR6A_Lc170069 [Agrobacterium sp. NCPPB 925]
MDNNQPGKEAIPGLVFLNGQDNSFSRNGDLLRWVGCAAQVRDPASQGTKTHNAFRLGLNSTPF